MGRYLVSWCEAGTLNFGCEIHAVRGPMDEAAMQELQVRLRKEKRKPKLTILAFSKFEGQKLPIINIKP